MTAKESKAVAVVGYMDEGGAIMEAAMRNMNRGWKYHYKIPLVPQSALHAAEAELGELRRRVGELRTKYEVRRDNWKKRASTSEWHNGHYMQARDIESDLQLLASDGGSDGDNAGEGK